MLAAILGTATLVTPPTGALLDHFRPKPILIVGNLTSALGYAGFAFADRAIALLGVLLATLIHSELGAAALLAGVATLFAIGECVHAVVLGPLIADLAPRISSAATSRCTA